MDKVFVGNIKTKETKFGQIEVVGINKADIQTMAKHMNEKGWVNLLIKTSKDGKRYLEVDTWKPSAEIVKDDMPF